MTENEVSNKSSWQDIMRWWTHFIAWLVVLFASCWALYHASRSEKSDARLPAGQLTVVLEVLAGICLYFVLERSLSVWSTWDVNHKLSEVANQVARLSRQRYGEVFLRKDLPEFVDFVSGARQVIVIAHTLSGHLAQKKLQIAEAVERGLALNVLLPNRRLLEDAGVRAVHNRKGFQGIEDEFRGTGEILMYAMERVEELGRDKKKGQGKVEVRLASSLPYLNTMIRTDAKNAVTLHCALYPHHVPFDRRPVIVLTDEKDPIFQVLRKQAEDLWRDSEAGKLATLDQMREYFNSPQRSDDGGRAEGAERPHA